MNELLTTQELATLLKVSPRWIQREVSRGLPCTRLGSARRLLRFDPDQVREWLSAASDRDLEESQ